MEFLVVYCFDSVLFKSLFGVRFVFDVAEGGYGFIESFYDGFYFFVVYFFLNYLIFVNKRSVYMN
jgi:hypothetical protein